MGTDQQSPDLISNVAKAETGIFAPYRISMEKDHENFQHFFISSLALQGLSSSWWLLQAHRNDNRNSEQNSA